MGHQNQAIKDLLRRLNSADAGPAWAEFIDCYATLVMRTASQFEYEQKGSNECFLYVCEKLYEQQFRRLLKFNTEGAASFSNWLSTVVFNLCVDWHRSEYGRATVLPAITALPAFDQSVYRCCYEQGMTADACYEIIRPDFPGLTQDQISASLGRIHSLLTPRQRWRLNVRIRGRNSIRKGASEVRLENIPDTAPTPEFRAQSEEEAASLKAALSKLTGDQQLLLRLRFQEGLTFERIARLEHLGNPHRARRHIQAALDALYIQLKKRKISQERQN